MATERSKRYIEKELSWLSFNQRVLQEAADKSVPIIERVRFLGIFSNNLDEFFRVRVADVKRRVLIDKVIGDETPVKRLLVNIQTKVLSLQEEFESIYLDVIIGLARHQIFLINEHQVPEKQEAWLRTYFRDKLLRHIAPIIVNTETNLAAVLKDDLTYLVCEMSDGANIKYAILAIPTDNAPRFIQLPHEKGKRHKNIILLDNIIRYCLDDIFSSFFSYKLCRAYAMKMTRDAEFGLTDDIDQSLVERMSLGLKQRLKSEPVRFVYEREMPAEMIQMLKSKMGISKHDSVVPGGRYHNFRDFIDFPNIGRKYLENSKLAVLSCRDFSNYSSVFEAIRAKDILLYYPYHKFDYFTELLRQAAFDPLVEDIKISVYRVARKSRIVGSLVNAVENGKKVTAVIELNARFDEHANIEWSKVLTEAGVKVEFGISSLKCHSKLCLITRNEKNKRVRYAHIGTGNFHEKTAEIYTDYSLFTCDKAITQEVSYVFDFIQHSYKRFDFKHLVVSPIGTRQWITDCIDNEIKAAKKGKKAEILVKVNNIDDRLVINKLYEASCAGVKIRMIVRGMCSLVAGIPGMSENIEVISIVDRYLEHARVAIFYNAGDKKVYISSADWMTRNIEGRVEVGCPIYDVDIKKRIIDIFELQWSDRKKSRVLDRKQLNAYKSRGNRRRVHSQVAIYDYLKAIESKK
jgi:polyphosphate kinase